MAQHDMAQHGILRRILRSEQMLLPLHHVNMSLAALKYCQGSYHYTNNAMQPILARKKLASKGQGHLPLQLLNAWHGCNSFPKYVVCIHQCR